MAIFSGDIFAEQYVISSSVTNVTIGSVSGSTAFGDSTDDTHQFTGSLSIRPPANGGLDIFPDSDGGTAKLNIKGRAGYRSQLIFDAPDSGYGDIFFKRDGQNRFNINYGYTSNELLLTATGGGATISAIVVDTSGNLTFGGTSISGSATSTGSFGKILQNGQEIAIGQSVGTTDDVTFDDITATGDISGSEAYFDTRVRIGKYSTSTPNNEAPLTILNDHPSTPTILSLIGTAGTTGESIDIKMNTGNNGAGTFGTILRHERQGSAGGDFIILTATGISATPTEVIRFTNDNKVGIGTISPSGSLHIYSGDAGGSSAIFNRADELVIENSDHAGITIKSPNDKETSVFFGDQDDSSRGGIRYNHATDTLSFQVAVTPLQLTSTKISGSSTSTGSFGNLAVVDSPLPTKAGASALNISQDGVTSYANLPISIQGSQMIGMLLHEDSAKRAAIYYDNVSGRDDFTLRSGDSFFRMPRTKNEFSGSASSTGSFGRLTVGTANTTETYKVNITGDKGLYINHTGGAWDAQGILLNTSATSGRGATIYGDDFTTGALVWLESNSSETTEHYTLNIHQNHASAVNSIPLRVTQDATTAMAAVFQGGEGKVGRVGIYADEGDDNDDKWMFEATTGAQFLLRSYQPGSWQTSFLVDQANTKFHIYENLDLSSGDFDVSGSATSTGSFGKLDFAGSGEKVFLKYTYPANQNMNVGLKHFDNGSGGQLVIAAGSNLTARIATFQTTGGKPRLGLGVTNPFNSIIAISAPADNDIQLDVSTGGAGYYGLGMASSGAHRYLLASTYSANTSRFSITMGGKTTASDKITIYNSSGAHYVGINKGATNPAHSLDVSGSIVFANGTQAVQISGSATSTGSFGQAFIGNKLGIGTTSPADSIDIQQTDSVIRFKNTGASNWQGIELYNPSDSSFVAAFGSYANTTTGYIRDAGGSNVTFNDTTWTFNRVVRMSDGSSKYGFHHQNNTYKTGFGGILGSAAQATIHISGSGNNIGLYSEGFISGSSTSTGSFGSLVVADAIQGSTTIKGGDFIPRGQLTTNTNSVVIGSSAYRQGTSGDRVVVIGENAAGFNSMNGDVDDTVLIGYRAGANVTSNFYNVAIGSMALYSNKTGHSNTAIGYRALYTEGSRGNNVAIGHNALQYQSGSSGILADNTAIGYSAGAAVTTATRLTLVGSNAGVAITTGGYNTMFGWRAGYNTTTGASNTFLGNYAGHTNLTGYSNTTVGGSSFYYNSTGYESVAVGFNAGYMFGRGSHTPKHSVFVGNNTGYYATGSYNTFIGHEAGKGGTTGTPYSSGEKNVAVGYGALTVFTTGGENVAVGRTTLSSLTSGFRNIALGMDAGGGTTTGNDNIFIGKSAGNQNVSGDEMVLIGTAAGFSLNHDTDNDGAVFIGYNAGYNYVSGGGGGVFIGYKAGQMADAAVTNAVQNTYIGYEAGRFLDDGTNNVALGHQAMRSIDADGNSAIHSVAIGFEALYGITDGDNNVAVGYQALKTHTTGHSNIAIGKGAMDDTDAGSNSLDSDNNIFIGNAAGGGTWTNQKSEYNTVVGNNAFVSALEAAVYNTALGYRAGESLTSADSSVIIGGIAGANITSGLRNVVIGYNAATTLTSGDYNIYIGSDANASGADVNDEILLAAGTGTLAGGGTETVRIGVDSDYITNDFGENATWTHSSDRRVKKNIEDNDLGLGFIEKLRTRKFQKKAPSEYPEEFEQHNPNTTERKNPDRIHYGFVAQEVKEAMDSVGHSEFPVWKENRDGMQELGETELITPLIKAVQELSSENKELKDELNELKIFIKKKLGDK